MDHASTSHTLMIATWPLHSLEAESTEYESSAYTSHVWQEWYAQLTETGWPARAGWTYTQHCARCRPSVAPSPVLSATWLATSGSRIHAGHTRKDTLQCRPNTCNTWKITTVFAKPAFHRSYSIGNAVCLNVIHSRIVMPVMLSVCHATALRTRHHVTIETLSQPVWRSWLVTTNVFDLVDLCNT